ncbi:MAG: EAL domain-containing protein, partial [Actinomycetota bacterium]
NAAQAVTSLGGQVEAVLGFTPDEWLADPKTWERQLHPDDRDAVVAESVRTARSTEPFRAEYRIFAKDEKTVWMLEEAVVVPDAAGDPSYWQGVMVDITEQKETEQQLLNKEGQFRALVEHIPAVFYIEPPDEAAKGVYTSPQIEEILGVTPQGYIDNPDFWRSHLHPDDVERASDDYEQFLATGEPEISDYRMIRADGKIVWIHDRSMILRDEEGNPILVQGAMFDVTEQREAEEQVAFMAHHDKLTGLPNRALFEEMLELALARARRSDMAVAVLYIDLDNFKLVNDSLGHEIGDDLLSALSGRMREATRETDLVARPGGDEFLVLLADIEGTSQSDKEGILLVAESVVSRIQQSLEEPFTLADTEVYVTASIGVGVFPAYASDTKTILKHADAAMYRSKKSGPGGYVVYSTDGDDPMRRLAFSTRLRKAVEGQNWILHYQPILDLHKGTMVGVEALIRWKDPTGGIIPPGEFIPLAEEMGLIEIISDWVTEEICRQSMQWRKDGLDLEISFNLSPRQLWQPDLADKIMASLTAAGLDPTRATIEITESTAMTDPDRTQQILWDLHGRGLKLAIDDFGTGYSSLSRLKHLPVSTLKIDRSFVMDIPGDPDAGSMVTAVIQLAHSLGMTSLAEGIETDAQWEFLVGQGCQLGQGFYFSKPIPSEDIMAMYRRTGLGIASPKNA